jgi:hypothetical protein
MPVFIQLRLAAIRLVRDLRRSMIYDSEIWTINADRQGRPIVSTSSFRICLEPRALRLFDAIHIYCDESEIWIPLFPRIRLRNAVRRLLLRYAQTKWAVDAVSKAPQLKALGQRRSVKAAERVAE